MITLLAAPLGLVMTDKEKRDLAANLGDDALDLDPGPRREAFIDEKCQGDSQLAQYVRHYLGDFKQVFATRALTYQIVGRTAIPIPRAAAHVLQGRYKVARTIGFGRMGKVFKAFDLASGQPVAIKVISGVQAGNEQSRIRFVREARAAGALRHRNIVAVHDIGQVRGSLYIAMEYVKGESLMQLLSARSPLSLRSKLSIMAQVADALAFAHAQGIVHRDIKPANILVTRDECVKLADFGIAGQADLPNSLVQGSGTLPYMSPEQLKRENLDATSDIWSAGISLFELLTGKLPYRSMKEILSAPAPQLPPDFPLAAELNEILERAVARDRHARYSTAAEFAADLRRVLRLCGQFCIDGDLPEQPASLEPELRPVSTDGDYTLPDLNFRHPTAGEVLTMVRSFEWQERRQAMLVRRGNFLSVMDKLYYQQVRRFPLTVVIYFLPLTAVFSVVTLIGWLALTLAVAACYFLECPERLPQCQGCRLHMKRTARWTRFVKTREEVIFGYRDCMAALKHHLWQEAAKLLSIHGIGSVSEYNNRLITPARYHLEFFECAVCSHHAARLTTDELIEGNWEQQDRYGEAYWGNLAFTTFRAKLAAAPAAYLRVFPELFDGLRKLRPSVPAVIAGCVLALLAAFIYYLRATR